MNREVNLTKRVQTPHGWHKFVNVERLLDQRQFAVRPSDSATVDL
jgi:hypothetical protein